MGGGGGGGGGTHGHACRGGVGRQPARGRSTTVKGRRGEGSSLQPQPHAAGHLLAGLGAAGMQSCIKLLMLQGCTHVRGAVSESVSQYPLCAAGAAQSADVALPFCGAAAPDSPAWCRALCWHPPRQPTHPPPPPQHTHTQTHTHTHTHARTPPPQVKLNRGLDFINLDDILVDLKLGPEVLEVPVPKYFIEDRAKELDDRCGGGEGGGQSGPGRLRR